MSLLKFTEGLSEDQIRNKVASSTSYDSDKEFDPIAFFDSFHDIGDPARAAAHALQALEPDGTVMLVEPFANYNLEHKQNPLGHMYMLHHL